MNWVYRLNDWYDDQEEIKRFVLFIIPMAIMIILIDQSYSPTITVIGFILMACFAGLRIYPFAFPRKKPPSA